MFINQIQCNLIYFSITEHYEELDQEDKRNVYDCINNKEGKQDKPNVYDCIKNKEGKQDNLMFMTV